MEDTGDDDAGDDDEQHDDDDDDNDDADDDDDDLPLRPHRQQGSPTSATMVIITRRQTRCAL